VKPAVIFTGTWDWPTWRFGRWIRPVLQMSVKHYAPRILLFIF